MIGWLRRWLRRDIVVHVHVQLEGEDFARSVTRHQQRARRGPMTRIGPDA